MKTILLGILTALLNLTALDCAAQATKLPKRLPDNVEIAFNSNGGMLYAFTKIEIRNTNLTVEEKNGDEERPRKWSATIEKSELEDLYKLFVENRFDTIENDEPKGIVYDAGSEGVSILAGTGLSFGKSYGPNSPMSGGDKKRYQTVANAIRELRARYEKTATRTAVDFKVFEYDPKNHFWIFKNAAPATLSDDEIGRLKNLVGRAVDDYNAKLKTAERAIKPAEYKFQFVPALAADGEKQVWVNAFCRDFPDWQTELVQVDDGGNCFFSLYVNLSKNSADRFSVNGEA